MISLDNGGYDICLAGFNFYSLSYHCICETDLNKYTLLRSVNNLHPFIQVIYFLLQIDKV